MNKIYISINILICSLSIITCQTVNNKKTKTINDLTEKECRGYLSKCVKYANYCTRQVQFLNSQIDELLRSIRDGRAMSSRDSLSK